MAFRSHVNRPLDLRLLSNRLLLAVLAAVGAGALFMWITGDPLEVFWAVPFAGVTWAYTREIDPDHDWTALVTGAAAGLWVLSGRPGAPALAIVGFLMAPRLVVNTTGRRPLTTDLVGLAVVATAISYTSTGWVGGFGVALGMYIDDRMAEGQNNVAVAAAAAAALGSSLVASLTGALPDQAPVIDPVAVAIMGALALVAILRAPPEPRSVVDSRMRFLIPQERLHAGRALSGVMLFIAATLAGPDAPGLYPLALAMALALASAEVGRR
jgi:hypothetical protein